MFSFFASEASMCDRLFKMFAFHFHALHANNEHLHWNLFCFSFQVPEDLNCVFQGLVTCPPDYAYDKFPRLLMNF
jgi:hypothetical protein